MNLPIPNQTEYLSAKPFPHAIFENVLDGLEKRKIEGGWPPKHERLTHREDQMLKGSTSDESKLGLGLVEVLRYLNSQQFLKWLEELTGIEALIPDPYYVGGGLHEIFPGGKLMVHTDFTQNPKTGLERRLNAIIYLNEDWQKEWNGDLELWDRRPDQPGGTFVKIPPVFGRLVVFNTTGDSYHGHPEVLKCPKNRSRRSLAMYYYTNTVSQKPKLTDFVERKGKDKVAFFKQFVPPIVMKTWVNFKRKYL